MIRIALLRIQWVLLAALLFINCGIDHLAGGGGSDVGNGAIVGKVVTSNGLPAGSTKVTVLPSGYNVVNDSQPDSAHIVTTDSTGTYYFKGLKKGSYSIQAVHSVDRTRLLISNITVSGNTITIPADTLKKTGAISVVLPAGIDTTHGYVYVPGTTVFQPVTNSSLVTIDSVPAGVMPQIAYVADSSSANNVIRYDVTVTEGDTSVITNSAWKYSKSFTLVTTAAGANVYGDVYQFPVLFRLSKNNFDFSGSRMQGRDVHIVDSAGHIVSYEIEQWDSAGGNAALWLLIDTIQGNAVSKTYTLLWGNDGAEKDSSNGAKVFDTANGFAGVWHMNEIPAGAQSVKDRTANGYNATPQPSMSSANLVDGVIGKGIGFNRITDKLNAGIVNCTQSFSFGMWVNINNMATYCRLLFKDKSYTLWYDSDRKRLRAEFFHGTTWRGLNQDGGDSVTIPTNAWYYLVSTFDGNVIKLYVNGFLAATSNNLGGIYASASTDSLYIGSDYLNRYAHGVLDEVRIERTCRSPDWIQLCYLNQQAVDKLVMWK
jgi:hypothetical protein